MSIYILAPDEAETCCACRPAPCEPCAGCPTTPTVEVVISGIAACCTAALSRLSGLAAVNGVHVLDAGEGGQYALTLPGAVTQNYFAASDCTSLLGSDDPLDVEIVFNCSGGGVSLDVRLASTGEHLLFDTNALAAGSPWTFAGEPACTALTPYTHGGAATVSAIEP